jgi:hypothetical protein
VAKQLNSLIKMRNAPVYGGRFVLTSGSSKNAKGKFAVYKVDNAGWPDEKTFRKARELHNGLAGKTINIDREPGQDDFPAEDDKGM